MPGRHWILFLYEILNFRFLLCVVDLAHDPHDHCWVRLVHKADPVSGSENLLSVLVQGLHHQTLHEGIYRLALRLKFDYLGLFPERICLPTIDVHIPFRHTYFTKITTDG